MAFKKDVKYGSVTLEFVAAAAHKLGFDVKNPDSLKATLYALGFETFTEDDEGNVYTAQIDRVNNVNVRCIDKPYMLRLTTVFSGRLRSDFKNARIYDTVDILDIGGTVGTALVNSMSFEIPATEKVNTRKYTKKEDRSDVIYMDLPEGETLDDLFNLKDGE